MLPANLVIEVTAEHIAAGRPNSGSYHPIALAAKKHLPGYTVGLGVYNLYAGCNDWYEPDDATRQAIDTYDETGRMEPFAAAFALAEEEEE